MFVHFSPNMLKTYENCPRKFYLKYVKNISMPVNDDMFLLGKNIHALAAYYLKGNNIDKMEASLSEKEQGMWNYLKSISYLSYSLIDVEYSLSVKLEDVFFGGRIDALVKNNDEYFILDYKTGSIPKDPKYDYQTMVYVLAVSKFFNTEKVNFVYLDLRRKQEFKISLNFSLKQEYIDRLVLLSKKINEMNFPDKNNSCECEYSAICF